MIRASEMEIRWHAIGKACLRLGIAFWAGFLFLALLNRMPEYKLLAQNSPWIPKYIGDLIAFTIGMIMIWRISKGKLSDYGFTLAGGNLKLKLSIVMGVILTLFGSLLNRLPEIIAGESLKPTFSYPLNLINIIGMLSFQWIFVGIFEETITRGLMQTYLMKKLKGTIKIFKWNMHIGSVITGIIFGLGHIGPHIFFGQSWLMLIPHIIFASLYGLCSSYIYQETKSLVGPILMHNNVDGLLYSIDYLFYFC